MFNRLSMNKQERNEAQWAKWTDQVLTQLPAHSAPATLAPRIRAAVARLQVLPWHRRPWLQWPITFKCLSLAVVGATSTAVSYWVLPHAPVVPSASAVVPGYEPAVTIVGAFSTLSHGLFQALAHSGTGTMAVVLGTIGVFWCMSLGLGTACWRLSIREN